MDHAAWAADAALAESPKPAWGMASVLGFGAGVGETIAFAIRPGRRSGFVATSDGVDFNYQSNSYDSATDTFHTTSANATFNYSVTGTIRRSGSDFVVQAHTLCYVETNF